MSCIVYTTTSFEIRVEYFKKKNDLGPTNIIKYLNVQPIYHSTLSDRSRIDLNKNDRFHKFTRLNDVQLYMGFLHWNYIRTNSVRQSTELYFLRVK